jgi:hypothetical protein
MALPLLAVAATAGSASASTWTGSQLSGEAAKVTMFGMSCPTTSLCVAVGGNNTVATSTDPGDGQPSWNVAYVGAGAQPTGGGIFPGRQIRGVDCPSPSLCVAVNFEGIIYGSTEPLGGAPAWSVTDLDGSGPNTHLYGISCPLPTFCAAAAGKGRIVSSTEPLGGQSAWAVTELGESLELRGISCPSPSLCVAVGGEGQIVSSTNPLGGAAAWTRAQLPGAPIDRNLYGVSCPTAGLCVSGDTVGELVSSTAPTGDAAAWRSTQGGGTVQVTAVDCLSTSQCVAVDNNGDVLTSTNPTGGPGSWTFANVLPYPQVDDTAFNAMFGVSCPSPSLCAISGNRGQLFTSSDPFTVAPPPAAPGKKSQKNKKRVKRPRTRIAAQPLPGIEIGGHRTKVRFRFFAMDHAFVRGFVCRLDGQKPKRCGSPKTHRVGLGRHVFRVRAIGWSGLKGPAAVSRFKVCHPTTKGWCIGQFGRRVSSRPGA